MFEVAYLTDSGLKHDHNEDALLINRETAAFVVADGMGGHEKGEIASRLIVESFSELSQGTYPVNMGSEDNTIVPSLGISDELNHCIEVATEKITKYADEKNIDSIIGSTVVGLKYVSNIRAWALFHLGDSRAYLFTNNSLRQLTTDHSKLEALKQNNASDEEIRNTGKNVLTKAIGNFPPYALDIEYIQARHDDIFLLCSDGVSDLCTNDELLRLAIQYKNNLELLCDQIKNLVYMRGAHDNLTVIAIRILPDE